MFSVHVIFQSFLTAQNLFTLSTGIRENPLEVHTLNMVSQLKPSLVGEVLTQ